MWQTRYSRAIGEFIDIRALGSSINIPYGSDADSDSDGVIGPVALGAQSERSVLAAAEAPEAAAARTAAAANVERDTP